MKSKELINMIKPDDWHLHLRDGSILEAVLPFSARQFSRAIVMPNTVPPITNIKLAQKYLEEINSFIPKGSSFDPILAAYLTDDIRVSELVTGYKEGIFIGAKLYPAGATTNSSLGVTNVSSISHVLETMEKIGMPLLVHGEVTDKTVDIFDREAVFIDTVMIPLIKDYPGLKIIFEHITSYEAVQFVHSSSHNIAATVTAHHLIVNRNAMFNGGIRPHMYCLPVAKRERDRVSLRKAVTSGSGKFFLGTDSAPHTLNDKENACGCAGIFSAPTALEFYAQVFDEEEALDKFEAFASINGPKFYGLPINKSEITLKRQKQRVPDNIAVSKNESIQPFLAGAELLWSFLET